MKLALKKSSALPKGAEAGERKGMPARSPTPVQVACGRQDVAAWHWRVDVQNAKIRGVRTPSAGAERSKGAGGRCADSRNSGCRSPLRKERIGTGGSVTQTQPSVISAATAGVTAATPEPQTSVDSSARGGGDGDRKLEAAQAGRELKGCTGNGEKTGNMVVKQLSSSMVSESKRQEQADEQQQARASTRNSMQLPKSRPTIEPLPFPGAQQPEARHPQPADERGRDTRRSLVQLPILGALGASSAPELFTSHAKGDLKGHLVEREDADSICKPALKHHATSLVLQQEVPRGSDALVSTEPLPSPRAGSSSQPRPAAECRDLTQTPPRQSQAGRTGSTSLEHFQDLERLSPLLPSPLKLAAREGALGGVGGVESARSASAHASGAPSMREKDTKFSTTFLAQEGVGGTAVAVPSEKVGWANLADRKPRA